MKRILLLTIFVLVFCFEGVGQECPTIKVIPPSKLPPENGFMLFSVSISGNIDSSKLEYKWNVSQGSIFDGQGTTAITILQDEKLDGEITATVEISGLPEKCENTFSDWTSIPPKLQCRCNEEYGKISWLDEMARLENMVVELIADPKAKVYFIFRYKTNLEKNLVSNRQKKILKFLEKRKISSAQILITYEKAMDYYTTIWVLPEGGRIPN